MMMSRTLAFASLLCVAAPALAPGPAHAADAPASKTTRLTWHGHAAFSIVTPRGHVLLVDPWLKNPLNPDKDPVASLKRVDYILITHGHFDHVGQAVEIAKKTGARLVATFELGTNLARVQGYPAKQLGMDTLGNVGGVLKIADAEVTVAFVPALHSTGLDAPDAETKGTPVLYGGQAVGYVLRIEGGPTIYHSGDTAVTADLDQVADWKPSVALLNIGGHFGMEPDAAARLAKRLKPALVVPHHFKTFPILTGDAAPFFKLLDGAKIPHRELAPGASLTWDGTRLQP